MRLPFLQVRQETLSKGRILARILKIPEAHGLGLLVALDAWALDESTEADTAGLIADSRPAEAIALGVGWDGDAETLLAGLIRVKLAEQTHHGIRILTMDRYQDALQKGAIRSAKASAAAQRRWGGNNHAPSIAVASRGHTPSIRAASSGDAQQVLADAYTQTQTQTQTQIKEPLGAPLQGALVDVPPTSPRAAVRKSPAREREPSTTPEERAARDMVLAVYQGHRSEAYPWGAADWMKLRDCLKKASGDLDVLESRWEHALSLGTKWPGCNTLAQLATKWADVLTSLQQKPGQVVALQRPAEQRARAGGDVPQVPALRNAYEQQGGE